MPKQPIGRSLMPYLLIELYAFADDILVTPLEPEVLAAPCFNESGQAIAGDTVSHNRAARVLLQGTHSQHKAPAEWGGQQ